MTDALIICVALAYGAECFYSDELRKLVRKNIYSKLVIGNICTTWFISNRATHVPPTTIVTTALITSLAILGHHLIWHAEDALIRVPSTRRESIHII